MVFHTWRKIYEQPDSLDDMFCVTNYQLNMSVTSKVMATNFFFGQTHYIEESSKYTYEMAWYTPPIGLVRSSRCEGV
jgi:hypothetical protein